MISGKEFDSAIKAHIKTENSKVTAQLNAQSPKTELSLLEAVGQFGEVKGLYMSGVNNRVTLYESYSLDALLNHAKTSRLESGLVARRYTNCRTKQQLSRSKSSDFSLNATISPLSSSMFKSKELHLENSLQIQKSRSNEQRVIGSRRSSSAKLANELRGDAGARHRQIMSELLFLEIGTKEQLPYHYRPEISEDSLPCKAAHSMLSADDESDGYTVLPSHAIITNKVEVVPSFVEYEESQEDSQKAKSALLLVKTQCNSEEGLSSDELELKRIVGTTLVQNPFQFGTQLSASDEGLVGHGILRAERQKGLVPVTVIADTRISQMHFFMYPMH